MIVNLSNVTNLKILDTCQLVTPSIFLEILKKAQQISSLSIDPDYLQELFNNNELCNYLNKMIKKLEICFREKNSFNNFDDLKKFCRIFSNKQLTCITEDEDFIYDIAIQQLQEITQPYGYDFVVYISSLIFFSIAILIFPPFMIWWWKFIFIRF